MTIKPLFSKLGIGFAAAATAVVLILAAQPDPAMGHSGGPGPPRPSAPPPRINVPVMPGPQIHNQIRQQIQNQRDVANRPGQPGNTDGNAADSGPDFDAMSDDQLADLFDELFEDVVNRDIGSSILDDFFDAAADPANADKDASELLDAAVNSFVESRGGSSADAENAANAVVDDIFGAESRLGWSDSEYNQPDPVVRENPPGTTSPRESGRLQEEIRAEAPVPPALPVEQQEQNIQQLPTVAEPDVPVPLDTGVAAGLMPGGGRVTSANITYDPVTNTHDIFIQKENGVDVLISVRADGSHRTTVVLPGTSQERIAARGDNPGVTVPEGYIFSPQSVYQDAPGGPALDVLITGLNVAATAGRVATFVISLAPGVGTAVSAGIQGLDAGANAYHDRAMQDVNAGRDINQLAAAGQGTVQGVIHGGLNYGMGRATNNTNPGSNRYSATNPMDAGARARSLFSGPATTAGAEVAVRGRNLGVRVSGAVSERAGQAIARGANTVGRAIALRGGQVATNAAGNILVSVAESAPGFISPTTLGGSLDRAVDRAAGAAPRQGR